MYFEKRQLQENKILGNDNLSYLDSKNRQKIALRSKKNNLTIITKRKNILEQTQTYYNKIKDECQFQIYNFSSSYNMIISYLKSSDDNLINYCLTKLCIYFKYNEPSVQDQKLIIEGQFFEILLNLGNKFIQDKNEKNIIEIIWILLNIQVYNEGNDDYLKILFTEKYMDFYYDCFTKADSDEIMNEIITLLICMTRNNNEIGMMIIKSKIMGTIINCSKNNSYDLEVTEMIVQLIVNCLNISDNYTLNEDEINIINDCFFILKKEISNVDNGKLQKLCFEGLYKISKLDNNYKFNEKMIKEEIPLLILKIKNNNNNLLVYSLKTLGNILTVSDKDCKIIYENDIISYYNDILNTSDDDHKLVKIILNSILNIVASKYRNIIKSCIIWNQDKIQKYLFMEDKIKLLLIKIIKYMINDGNYSVLQFLYKTQILEYLIFLLSNFNLNEKVCIKIIKVIDLYLQRFKSNEKQNIEYTIVYNKFKDFVKSSDKITKNNSGEVMCYIEKNIINNYQ